jgi:polyphosphate kinase
MEDSAIWSRQSFPIPMSDYLAQSIAYLREAQRTELSLTRRLNTIGLLSRAIDAYCVQRTGYPHTDSDDHALIVSLLQEAAQLLRRHLIPQLQRRRIYLPAVEQLGEQQQEWLADYFRQRIHPLLTPLAVDPGHPFPYISSESLNLLVLLQKPGRRADRTLYARVKVPRHVTARLIEVPPLAEVDSPVLHHDGDHHYWVWSEDVVGYYIQELFPGMSVTGIYQFRVLRAYGQAPDADPFTNEPVRDKTAPVVRIDVQQEMPPSVLQWLTSHLDAPPQTVFRCIPPLGMANWGDVAAQLEALTQKI